MKNQQEEQVFEVSPIEALGLASVFGEINLVDKAGKTQTLEALELQNRFNLSAEDCQYESLKITSIAWSRNIADMAEVLMCSRDEDVPEGSGPEHYQFKLVV